MLILQESLNHLKLRSLVAEATSSRLQISASSVEAAIVKAEGLDLSMDEMVGKLVATMNRLNLRENTLVLFTGDNGTAARSKLRHLGRSGKKYEYEKMWDSMSEATMWYT